VVRPRLSAEECCWRHVATTCDELARPGRWLVFNPPPLAAVGMHGYKVSALAHTGAFSLCSSRVRCHVK
jgi:hypothetical protein